MGFWIYYGRERRHLCPEARIAKSEHLEEITISISELFKSLQEENKALREENRQFKGINEALTTATFDNDRLLLEVEKWTGRATDMQQETLDLIIQVNSIKHDLLESKRENTKLKEQLITAKDDATNTRDRFTDELIKNTKLKETVKSYSKTIDKCKKFLGEECFSDVLLTP